MGPFRGHLAADEKFDCAQGPCRLKRLFWPDGYHMGLVFYKKLETRNKRQEGEAPAVPNL